MAFIFVSLMSIHPAAYKRINVQQLVEAKQLAVLVANDAATHMYRLWGDKNTILLIH
jgi:hypothetical protein